MYYKVAKILMALIIGNLGTAGPIRRKMAAGMLQIMPGQLSCQEVDAFIVDYTENRLDASARKPFDFHMSVCPMCRSSLSSYLKTIELSKAATAQERDDDAVNAPPDLVNAILAATVLSEKDKSEDGPEGGNQTET